jgi:solute carrier family 25 (mitochondrial phosphate transporter), member 23/24/25/41
MSHPLEFRVFVEKTEERLWQMFKNIDRDHNGVLDRNELRQAFQQANITISETKLLEFFNEIDTNHDGRITFDEWR